MLPPLLLLLFSTLPPTVLHHPPACLLQPWGRYWDRWLMMALIGVAVGLVGYFLHLSVHILAAIKYHGTR